MLGVGSGRSRSSRSASTPSLREGEKKTGVGTLVTVVDERAILEILNAMKVAKFGAGRGAFIGHF